MSADGVIPPESERQRPPLVAIGSLQDMSGRPLAVAVNGDHVMIGPFVLDEEQGETFAALYLRAWWIAGVRAKP